MRVTVRAVVIAVLLAPVGATAQTTVWGDPDLQGIWSNQTPIPLERPPALANKPFFTKEEAAEVEKNALGQLLKRVSAGIPVSGELNEIWLETGKGKVSRSLATSLIVDPPDGRIPFTTEGRVRFEESPRLEREMGLGKPLGVDKPEDRAESERCTTTGGIFVPNPFYNNFHQIVQAPGYVVILSEMMHEHRIIPLDRRPHVGAGVRQWLGDSRGWWEGKTLVVETTNFNDQRLFQGSTRDVKLVERFTRTDNDTISYRLTVTDPNTYEKPWTLENTLWRSDEPIFEVACHEGNYGMFNILAAGRAAERK
jgi:hypothetical protein